MSAAEDEKDPLWDLTQQVLDRLQSGEQGDEVLRQALAVIVSAQAKSVIVQNELRQRVVELEQIITKPREERDLGGKAKSKRVLQPTPAMQREAMIDNARNARIARAAKASGFEDRESWLDWCQRHEWPVDRRCRDVAGHEAQNDARQVKLPLAGYEKRAERQAEELVVKKRSKRRKTKKKGGAN